MGLSETVYVIFKALRHRRRWLLPRRVWTLLLTQARYDADADQFPWFPYWGVVIFFSPGVGFCGLSRAGLRVSMMAIHSPQLMAYHRPLPGPDDLSFLLTQACSSIYPPVHEVPDPGAFTVASPNPNEPVPYHKFFFNPQHSGSMPIVTPSTHYLSAAINAGRSLTYNGLHGCSSTVSKFLRSRVCVACLCSIPTV